MVHMTVRTGYQQIQRYFHMSGRQPNDLCLRKQGRETVAGSMKNVTFIVKIPAIFSGFSQLSIEGEVYGTVLPCTKEA